MEYLEFEEEGEEEEEESQEDGHVDEEEVSIVEPVTPQAKPGYDSDDDNTTMHAGSHEHIKWKVMKHLKLGTTGEYAYYCWLEMNKSHFSPLAFHYYVTHQPRHETRYTQ